MHLRFYFNPFSPNTKVSAAPIDCTRGTAFQSTGGDRLGRRRGRGTGDKKRLALRIPRLRHTRCLNASGLRGANESIGSDENRVRPSCLETVNR